MSTKILVIDDEDDVLDFISYNLDREGYEILKANDGQKGLELAKKERPDLILLDIMMPDIDGIEVCRQLRNDKEFDNTIIAFLTARGEDYTQVAALDYGGDDFIIKPIKPTILKSRIKALMRRKLKAESEEPVIDFGELRVDPEQFLVTLKGAPVELAKKEFQILLLLLSNPGKVFSREAIFRRIWSSEVIVGERTIDVHIRRIREKIGDEYIKTLKGVGYKIEYPGI